MKNKAYVFALTASLLWGSSAAIVKLLLKNLNSLQILLYASLFASITLFLIVVFQNKFSIIRSYKIKDYLRFAYMGFIGVFLYYFFLYLALSYLKAQEAFIINYLWPIMIVIFAVPILGEKFTTKKTVAILLSFIGVVIIATQGNLQQLHFAKPLGVILAVIAAVSYAIFSVLGKKQNDDKTTSMMFYYIFTFVYTLIAVKIFGFIPHVVGIQLIGLLWTGVFTSGGAFLLWFLALKYGDTTKIANIAFLTPFFSLIYIYFLLHEKIQIYSIIGLIFICIGIFIQNRKSLPVDTKL
jgi:drug/metabolite transporter (DMT)-like permease